VAVAGPSRAPPGLSFRIQHDDADSLLFFEEPVRLGRLAERQRLGDLGAQLAVGDLLYENLQSFL
jgi:hypothetical protein